MNDKCQVLSADLVGRPAENLSGRVSGNFRPSVHRENLRLLLTFVGVLREKKIHRRACFTKILTNYTLEESLLSAVYDENII